jgi:hypothetical protein
MLLLVMDWVLLQDMIIVKNRNGKEFRGWVTYHNALGLLKHWNLNATDAKSYKIQLYGIIQNQQVLYLVLGSKSRYK